ncbi:MAG TPA: hypothetical protein DEP48_03365 [Persephonella sp.]|uniref:Uncharacterized protein n=1 Tax=Persephonella marina (strain DSM 14350 / EX-H1) TaxID=123214 RepID=C0QSI6_PERMH|nr:MULTISPECIES: hypothetical protein [Persephonella]ACO03338.1 hypothetical protein PERMA_1870 [Persephonella marina EX-H1]HCB69378.1 hypothetical protein [Persephonella sp.]
MEKELYGTLTMYGDPELEVVDELRLAIHDSKGDLIFATYWETSVMEKEDIIKSINVLCSQYGIKELHTIEDILPPEFEEVDGQKLRIFRTKIRENQ